MHSEKPVIAVSQRVVDLPDRGETRDCLDQAWCTWLGSLGFLVVPVPNRLERVADFLDRIRPAGVVLSGGNNLALPVYADLLPGTRPQDAFESRDRLEASLTEYAIQERLPLLGCCRGMQFLQAHFGGRLHSVQGGTINHIAHDHPVTLLAPEHRNLAGCDVVTVNSYHGYGIARDEVAAGFRAVATASDGTVEAFAHVELPIVGTMWHPERRNPSAGFDLKLAQTLFRQDRRA